MTRLISLHDHIFQTLERAMAPWLVPSLARLIFAGTLFVYYWRSAQTKLGDGPFSLELGAYVQMFPRQFEAAGYDPSGLGPLATPIALLGTWAEFVLPVLIVIGLLTRLSAVGMIGFVVVQTAVDIIGHGLSPADIGAWFDNDASALIADQRAYWVFLLGILVLRGAGPVSVDAVLSRVRARQVSAASTSAPQPR